MHNSQAGNEQLPLLSGHLVAKLVILAALLVAATTGISVLGKFYGHQLALAGHTDDTTVMTYLIGEDMVDLPANMVRFAEERHTGRIERVDAYIAWPEMSGYTDRLADRFNNADVSGALVFLQLSQSVMTRDMSGRLDPIYSRLFDGKTSIGPAGLTIHTLKQEAGFGDDVIMTAARPDGSTYVVRCMLPKGDARPSDADCQRDVHVGKDLSMIYRFSSDLLGQWQELDGEMMRFASSHVRH